MDRHVAALLAMTGRRVGGASSRAVESGVKPPHSKTSDAVAR
jgi:hypothetical protein